MTEKRFELIWETDEMCNVFDNDLDVNSTLSVEDVVDLLNNYSEENEQLKSDMRTNYKQYKQLLNENEALKQENRLLRGQIEEYIEQIRGETE